MPGAALKWHVLHDLAVATDQQVRRHAQVAYLLEIRMRRRAATSW